MLGFGTLAAIQANAGIALNTFYKYFRDKEQLANDALGTPFEPAAAWASRVEKAGAARSGGAASGYCRVGGLRPLRLSAGAGPEDRRPSDADHARLEHV